MELKLYNRLKHKLLRELASRAESHDKDYQKHVESFDSATSSGIPKAISKRIERWLSDYNRYQPRKFVLRYYQVLALFFTEHVLSQKRSGKGFTNQKALAYWMATGSGKTLLMHLNILQYIEHIGDGSAFDELQIILTTPGVNLIEQHERELGEFIRQLNRIYNNRLKLIVATTGALLNREPSFYNMPDSSRMHRLILVDEGHIGLSSTGDVGAFKQLRHELLKPENAFLFEYSATYHGIAEKHIQEYEEQIVYDYNYYRFYRDGYGKGYALQSLSDDRFADDGKSEAAFFGATFETLSDKLKAHQQLVVSQKQGAGELPFEGHFTDKPLLAFMGNTVEDPKKEGKDNDEVSDIRRFIVWLAHLNHAEREAYSSIFNGQYSGKLTLTRSPGVSDEIWLSWGDGQYWGLINVGNGEKFFSDCEAHPRLIADNAEPKVVLSKAPIINARYHFDAIDDVTSPINVLVGSRKFAEGWNCFRVSIIGLINLGSSKGNKVIQIFGRGVRLKGLRGDGKRRHIDHHSDYSELLSDNSSESQLQRLETLNVFSLNRSWLQTFLDALERDLPVIAGSYHLAVQPSVVQVGTDKQKRRPAEFAKYKEKLHAFKVGQSEFDSSLKVTLVESSGDWVWEYIQDGQTYQGTLPNLGFKLDYRSDRGTTGENVISSLRKMVEEQAIFLDSAKFKDKLSTWQKQQRVQLYCSQEQGIESLTLFHILGIASEVLYDQPLEQRSWSVVELFIEDVQRELLGKIFHKVRYDIDKRFYRFETIRQNGSGIRGDFIDRYAINFEFEKLEQKQAFEADQKLKEQLEGGLQEDRGDYHIYEPLLREAPEQLLKKHKLKRIGISPDSLNAGERKFVRDILSFIDKNYSRDHREFYLMRNVESLRSIGVYLEGETRVFYPDFVLWIVDEKLNKTTLALFDPKGQTGIVNEAQLGLGSSSGMNEKVSIAKSGQLEELAKELATKTGRKWAIQSFILLRDSSPLGRWKGAAPKDSEMELAEQMIARHVLRLDWHGENELGQSAAPLSDGSSYLSRIFKILE